MPADGNPVLSRITAKPGVRAGQPCVRNTRVTVWEVLQWLAAGASQQAILEDYPYLQAEDFQAVFAYTAEMGHESDPSLMVGPL